MHSVVPQSRGHSCLAMDNFLAHHTPTSTSFPHLLTFKMDAFRAQLDELMGKDRNLLVCDCIKYFFLHYNTNGISSHTKRTAKVNTLVIKTYASITFVAFALLNSSQIQKVI